MNKASQELARFAQTARGLDNTARLKLILFAIGKKQATFFPLKITPENLDEKEHLEKHLRESKTLFIVGRPRAYEEITGIKGNAVQWQIKGTWYGYDVFADKKKLEEFNKYMTAVRRQQHKKSDRLAGRLYNYPKCCTEHYIKEHDLEFLRKNYTNYSYYKHLHDIEKAFPLVQHTACSAKCSATRRMNKQFALALKKHAPKFWKTFSAKRTYNTSIIVDTASELTEDIAYGIRSTKPVFKTTNGGDYALITMKPVEGHRLIISHLSRKRLERGTVFPAHVTLQYATANVKLGKPKKQIKNLHHERHFVLP